MSGIAVDGAGRQVQANDALAVERYRCPLCKEQVYFVRAAHITVWQFGEPFTVPRASHFRHSPNSTCNLAKTETKEHLTMKAVWRSAFQVDQYETPIPSRRKPDLVIIGHDGKRRSVECQHSPIDVHTVAGRIKDHNTDGLSVAWSFSPARLRSHDMSIFDGVTEALEVGKWRTVSISTTNGEVSSAHVFCDIRFIDKPDVIRVPINLAKTELVDVSNRSRQVTVPGTPIEAVEDAAIRARKPWDAMRDRHEQFLDYVDRTKEFYGDEDDGEAWRRKLVEWGADEAQKYAIPIATPKKNYRIHCDRIDQQRQNALAAKAQETKSQQISQKMLDKPATQPIDLARLFHGKTASQEGQFERQTTQRLDAPRQQEHKAVRAIVQGQAEKSQIKRLGVSTEASYEST